MIVYLYFKDIKNIENCDKMYCSFYSLVYLWLSNGTSEKIRDSQTCRYNGQIYFHWYIILGLLYKRALFDLQFVDNSFWLKLKWNARSKLFYCIIYRSSIWSSRTLTKLKSQSQKCFNERKYQHLKYKNKNHSGTDT